MTTTRKDEIFETINNMIIENGYDAVLDAVLQTARADREVVKQYVDEGEEHADVLEAHKKLVEYIAVAKSYAQRQF